HAFAEGRARRDLEGHHVRIDVVVRAVDQGGLEVDRRITRIDSRIEGGLEALLHARNIFPRHGAADDGVLELETAAAWQGLEAELDARKLAGAARLLLVGVVVFDRLRDGLAEGDLRLADIGLNLELALHAIDDDLEVQLAHSLDDGLAALLVRADPK